MTAAKQITLTLDDEELAWAEERAKKDARPLEEVVREAVRVARQVEARRALLKELGGDKLTLAELEDVEREILGR